jgi:nucleotide-binding universal stress UspA family protein
VRILCPTDGSPRAAAAIDKLIASFTAAGVTVDLLAVALARDASSARAAERHAQLEAHLAAERKRLESAGFGVAVTFRTGHPAEEILTFAEASGPDLVILGSRSADGDGRGYSGRVAGNVARHCHVPVLIARDGAPIASIVLGYDESPDADAALGLVERLPFCTAPSMAVCSSYEVGDTLMPALEPAAQPASRAARLEDLVESRHAAEEIAADAAARLGRHGLPATGHALHGRASAQLEILAAELGADLIVVGSRGLSGAERFLLGSTSDELVVSARTSVLVARS